MAKIVMTVELDYDAEAAHGGDSDDEAKAWFFGEILHEETGELLLHSNNLGDTVGKVRVVSVAAPSNMEMI